MLVSMTDATPSENLRDESADGNSYKNQNTGDRIASLAVK